MHRDKTKRAPTLLTRWSRAPLVRDIPELELVTDEALRNRILAQIERDMTRRSWKSLGQFLVAVVLFLIIPIGLGSLVSRVLMPPNGPWNNRVFLAIVLVTYTIIVYWALRRDMPKALRTKLNANGIPVCMRCGHDLRGGADDRTVCPECGTRLSNVEVEALAKAAASPDR